MPTPVAPVRVPILWLDVLEAPRPVEGLERHTFNSPSVFEAFVRLLAERGGVAVVAVTWADGRVAGFRIDLERHMVEQPEPFLHHVRGRLAHHAAGDVGELREEARELLQRYQVVAS